MAERLLFRQPEHNLKVQVSADRTDYVPGDRVTINVATADDTGKDIMMAPLPGSLGGTVKPPVHVRMLPEEIAAVDTLPRR